jgi:hypothetical protein
MRRVLVLAAGICLYLCSAAQSDDCAAATAITTNPYGTSCSTTTPGTTVGATASVNSPTCASGNTDDDVWYTFTASSASIVLRFSLVRNAATNANASISFALYEAACPASSASFYCEGSASLFSSGYRIIPGLTPGTIYYLRLWSPGTANRITFNICVQDVPPAPANDECSNAIAITTQPYGSACTTPIAANTTGATMSSPNPSCTSADHNDDIWYSFTANSASIILRFSNVIETVDGSTGSLGYALYAGNCPATTTVFSCDNNIGFGSGHTIITGLTPGTTYLLRLYSSNVNDYTSFNFCIQDVPAPPANNECANAIAITTQPFGGTCAASVSVNTTGASASTPATTCTTNDINDDVWYSFTANSASIILRFANLIETTDGSTGSLGYALYNASCPVSTAAFSCSNTIGFGTGYRIIDGLTIGNTYYLRLYGSGANNYVSFTFCVQDVPATPVNNECANAIAITTQSFGTSCTNSIAANTSGATLSTPNTTCSSTDHNDDIWYSFTANSASIIIRFSNLLETIDNSTGSLGYALYNTDCPSTTAAFSCNNNIGFENGERIIDGLIPGNTYLLRLYGSGANNYVSFNFCIQDVPPAPVNNECSTAIPIVTQPFGVSCAASIAANTTGATASTPGLACTTGNNDDIWYSFTANSASIILRFSNAIETIDNSTGQLGYALYNSSCPSTTAAFACEAFIGFGNGYRIIDGLTIGNTYYLRLFSEGPNNYMSFNFCVQDVPAPPVNNECATATPLTLVPALSNCFGIAANTTGATRSPNSSACVGSAAHDNDDIWYSFVATGPTAVLRFNNAVSTTAGNTGNLGYALYNSCPASAASVVCSNFVGFGNGNVLFNTLTAGNTYYLRLYAEGPNNYMSFNFCVQEPVPNDECVGAITIPVSNGFCNTPVVATLDGATISPGFAAPSCHSIGSAVDVWFSATVPATGNLIVQTSAVSAVAHDLVMTAYTGSCGALTQIACDNNGNPEAEPSADHSRIVLTSRPPGQLIIFRVTPALTFSEMKFAICAWDETPSVRPAISPGGNCVAAPARTINAANGNIYMWVPVFDNSGNIIAEIYSDGNNLGTVDASLFVNSGAVRQHAGQFYLDRNIALQTTTAPSSLVKMRYYIRNAELAALQAVDPGVTNINSLQMIKTSNACLPTYNGSGSILVPTSGTYGTDHYLQASTNSFSSFYFNRAGIVLPLKFLSFSGRKTTQGNMLNWVVVKDMSIVSLKLERSEDGTRFTVISEKRRDDFIREQQEEWEYSYTDATAGPVNYYRVKMEDASGAVLYSTIIRLTDRTGTNMISLYPNPASTTVRVELPGNNTVAGNLSLYDMNGRMLKQIPVAINQAYVIMDVVALNPGMYLIAASINGVHYYNKFIKQ